MSPQVSDEMVEIAASAMYSRYVAATTRDRIPRAYLRRWRELDEEHKEPWRKCVREVWKAAHANAPPELEDILGDDGNANNT